ncbi:MAG: PhnD/SsuA/transferrin family substrate-binding protein, partial [Pleurocapsa sp.]
MANNLSHKLNSAIKEKKSNLSKSWKSGVLILSLGGLILPIASLPSISKAIEPLVAQKVSAQEAPTVVNSTRENTLVKVAVLSKEDVNRTIAQWQPTVDYLTKTIPGYTFELVPKTLTEMEPYAAQNQAQFYIINSGMYVDFEASLGANRIATRKNLRLGNPYTKFGGVLITKADRNDINTLKDLKGKDFMAVTANSFGGWHMAKGVLFEEGIENPEKIFAKLDYGNTHDNVIKAVASGQVDAGTIRTAALERAVERGDIKLEDFKIINEQQTPGFSFIHSTPLYPEWPFASAKGNDLKLDELVAQALLSMPKDGAAAKASKSEGWTVPLNYRPVHELFIDLQIAPYDEIGRLTIGGFIKKYHWIGIGVLTALTGLISYAFYTQRQSIIQEKQTQKSLNELNKSLAQSAAEQKQQREELETAVVGLMEALEPAAEGELTVRAQLSEGDVGIIADLFNAIVENFRDIALLVKDSAGQVGSSLKQNEGSVREIAEQAEVEAKQILATLSSVEEMSTSIQDVATNAEKTATISNEAFVSAKEGNTVMDQTVDSIQGLRTTIGDTAKNIKRLGESAQQISQVVALIDEIALKTNLLAINASVEAARAGELGQGFTAVAEQVGALAEQSANATKEIAQLITGIQQETQEVV